MTPADVKIALAAPDLLLKHGEAQNDAWSDFAAQAKKKGRQAYLVQLIGHARNNM